MTASVFCSHPISDLAALICRVITSIVHLSFATIRTIERFRLYATRMLSRNPSTVLRSRKHSLGQLLGHHANTQGGRIRLSRGLIDTGDVGRHPFSAIGRFNCARRDLSLVAAAFTMFSPVAARARLIVRVSRASNIRFNKTADSNRVPRYLSRLHSEGPW